MNALIRCVLIGLERLGIYVGKEGVFLNELRERPILNIVAGDLVISSTHSMKHSAKEVFRFKAIFEGNRCFIRGDQKLVTRTFGKKYQQTISIRGWLDQYPLEKAQFYWVDPDETRHLMQVSS